jgi:hypothetical protein
MPTPSLPSQPATTEQATTAPIRVPQDEIIEP